MSYDYDVHRERMHDECEEQCPACGSTDISKRHHDATAAVPECDYKQCDDCAHQWGHE